MSNTFLPAAEPRPRKQCAKCPWKKSTNPFDIPGQYCAQKHAALGSTIARPGELRAGSLSMMACHETKPGKELPCVGWLVHQLGPGNNLSLRVASLVGRVDANVETVGPQHERFEDTLPKERPTLKQRVFVGFRAKTLDAQGQVIEYTDPMPSRREAVRLFRRESKGLSLPRARLVTVKVYRWRYV